MKKFNISVHRVDEYEIEIDEAIYDEKALEAWSSNFHEVFNVQELAECLARQIMTLGSSKSFIEGFGYIKAFTNNDQMIPRYKERYQEISSEEYSKGISVKILTEDQDYECETTEIN